MSEETLKVESKETEVKAEIHEAEEESELSQSTMLKHLDENKDKNEDYESLPSVESTTDSIEAISNALNVSADTILFQVLWDNWLPFCYSQLCILISRNLKPLRALLIGCPASTVISVTE